MKGSATWLLRIVAAATLLMALLLCWHCVDIYRQHVNRDAADALQVNMYRPDDVGARLQSMVIPAAAYAVLCAAAGVADAGQRVVRPGLTAANRLRLLRARREPDPSVSRLEGARRNRYRITCGAVIILCAAIALRYLLDGANFTSWELETVMGQLLLNVAPWAAIALAAGYCGMLLCDASREREIAALKSLPAVPVRSAAIRPARSLHPLRIALYAIAVLFIVLGVMNGGLRDVLVKAINICTECIGLG